MSAQRVRIAVHDDSGINRAIAETLNMAGAAGVDGLDSRRLATVVSELGRNVLKYAGSGSIVLEPLENANRVGFAVTAIDRGPGIEDVTKAMEDHFSSGGTLGLGLPGVKRIMDDLIVDSEPGRGTRVRAVKWLTRAPTGTGRSPPQRRTVV